MRGMTVSVTITGSNDAPVLTGSAAVLAPVAEDTPKSVGAGDLVRGFTDADGDARSATNVTADHGTVTTHTDGSVSITPDANYICKS